MRIDDLLDKAEELGWCIHESDTEWEFIQNSPAGEDFFFDISASDVHNAGDMVREIRSYANDFDTEEHIKMWIEAQGHVSGVPDIKTLVRDYKINHIGKIVFLTHKEAEKALQQMEGENCIENSKLYPKKDEPDGTLRQ